MNLPIQLLKIGRLFQKDVTGNHLDIINRRKQALYYVNSEHDSFDIAYALVFLNCTFYSA